jgi:hypothetical protein
MYMNSKTWPSLLPALISALCRRYRGTFSRKFKIPAGLQIPAASVYAPAVRVT